MKKYLFCVLALVAVILCPALYIAHGASAVYPMTARVIEVNQSTGLVTVEDSTGNLWDFEDAAAWHVGDFASLLMNDCGTASIYDDVIEIVCNTGKWGK